MYMRTFSVVVISLNRGLLVRHNCCSKSQLFHQVGSENEPKAVRVSV